MLDMQAIVKGTWLNLGFRPFFLGAAGFSIISIALWMGVYLFQLPLDMVGISTFQWHAHEMIYGFSMAVIAGFLLTAVMNWTGVQTIYGYPLLGMFMLWLLARILLLFGTTFIAIAGLFDMGFMLALIAAFFYPIYKAKQWRQLVILGILVLLLISNGCFYSGAIRLTGEGVHFSIYSGLFLVLGLVLFISRRIMPFFIEVGVGYPIKVKNSQKIDKAIITLYSAFIVAQVLLDNQWFLSLVALLLFITHAFQLYGWHTQGIWKKPMLSSLFVALLFINLGFLLTALSAILQLPHIIVVHVFSLGGIGLITLSMMSRVTIGHTGRNVQRPRKFTVTAFGLLIAGTVFRALVPLVVSDYYLVWVGISQVLWISAFSIFLINYAPMLVQPRPDGKFG